MTNQEVFDKLNRDHMKKHDAFRKLDNNLSHIKTLNDPMDLKELATYDKARNEWIIAWNNLFTFLGNANSKNVKPEDEYHF